MASLSGVLIRRARRGRGLPRPAAARQKSKVSRWGWRPFHPPLSLFEDLEVWFSSWISPDRQSHRWFPLIFSPADRGTAGVSLLDMREEVELFQLHQFNQIIGGNVCWAVLRWPDQLKDKTPGRVLKRASQWPDMRLCNRGVMMLLTTAGAFCAFSLMTIAVGTDYWLYSRGMCRSKSQNDNETVRKNEEVLTHSGLWRTCCTEGRRTQLQMFRAATLGLIGEIITIRNFSSCESQ